MLARPAFDPSLPVITTAAFACGEKMFAADEPFPWRELGVSEIDLHALWRAAMVTCVEPPPESKTKRRSPKQQPAE